MNYVRVVLATALALAAVAVPLEAATATWDRNPEPTVTGYRLSYGTQSGVHPTSINVGNVLTYQFFPPSGARYYVVIQAYNSSGALSPKSAEAVLDLTGSQPPPQNQPPVLTQPANQTSVRNTAVSLSLIASDPQGTPVSYTASGLPAGLTVNGSTGVISGTVTTAATYTVTATASDGSLTASRTFTWTVTASTNRAPVLTQPANQTSAEGSAVSIALSASDPDGNPLTFSATGLPAGVTINTASGLVSGTPSYTSAGTASVTATASDGSLSASRTFSWTITNTNRAPALAQPANQTSAVNTSVSLLLSATDPDGTPLTYQATGLPSGLAINTSTGLISGVLGAASAGVRTVTATASDGALTSSRTFTWSVGGTDIPLAGDFDGDRRSDPATFRPSRGEWRVWPSGSGYVATAPIVWGISTDIPVPADYDGDRRTDLAVYRPSTGTWHVLLSSTNMQSNLELQWGSATDRPLPIDYDRDGRADLALPRAGSFEILLSGSNYTRSVTVR